MEPPGSTARQQSRFNQATQTSDTLFLSARLTELSPELFCGLKHLKTLHIVPDMDEISVELWPAGRKYCGVESTIPEGLFEELTSLTALHIHRKGITRLRAGSFAGLSQLAYLNLGGNRIQTIDKGAFDGLNRLTALHLDHNRLSEVKKHYFEALHSLLRLDLDSNHIRHIEGGSFVGNPDLASLSLVRNRLSRLDKKVFTGLRKLAAITLNGNPLNTVTPSTFAELGTQTQVSLDFRGRLVTSIKAYLELPSFRY